MTQKIYKKPQASPYLKGVTAYKAAVSLAPIDLKLDANEGQAPPKSLLDNLDEMNTDVFCRYQKPDSLEALLACEYGVSSDQVIITAGGDDAIDRLCKCYLPHEREIIIPCPTFEIFVSFSKLYGGKPVRVNWTDAKFPEREVLLKINEHTAAIVIISPNNPTGYVATIEQLRSIAGSNPQVLIILDLAYGDFADKDLFELAREFENVVALFTFSKAWGLAGLRVGYSIGSKEIIDNMRCAGTPYPVSNLSWRLAEKWRVLGRSITDAYIAQIKSERTRLYDLLKSLGAKPYKSQANFVFSEIDDPDWMTDALAGFGILIKRVKAESGFAGGFRITCPGNEADYLRLASAIQTILKPQAILFDMDGVLADVSASYREAIRLTVLSYGVTLEHGVISKAKNEHDANNDWEVSRKLLVQNGVIVDIKEVTARFEEFYQGTENKKGLWEVEKLRINIDLLKNLAARFSLGIVTGRPRSDAERFLRVFEIEKYFSVLLCMGDTKAKPDPAPVILALEKLGVDRAWMLGDAPDDILAARAANVLPLGVIDTEDKNSDTAIALQKAGAARLITDFTKLEELLK